MVESSRYIIERFYIYVASITRLSLRKRDINCRIVIRDVDFEVAKLSSMVSVTMANEMNENAR